MKQSQHLYSRRNRKELVPLLKGFSFNALVLRFRFSISTFRYSIALTFLLTCCLFACSEAGNFSTQELAKADYANEVPEAEESAASYDQNESGQAVAVAIERKIIKTGAYSIKVKDVKESTAAIEKMVEEFEGFISSVEMNNSTYRITNQVVIRVPAGQFDDLMAAIEKEALFVNYSRVNAQDVTEEYLDVETRLNTKKQVRDRYVAILRDKAKTVEEVLKAEEAIRVIQEEIESREGRLNYLKNRVSLSTINLEIYQEVPYTPDRGQRTSFWTKLKQSMSNGWTLIVNLVLGLVTIWPLLIIGGLLLWRWKWLKRKLFGK